MNRKRWRLSPLPLGNLLTVLLVAFLTLFPAPAEKSSGDRDKQITETILLYHRNSGGWPKNYDRAKDPGLAFRQNLASEKSKDDAMIDNGATYTEIRLLAQAYQKERDERFREAALRGITYLLDAQYDNGGWPQKYPNPKAYSQYITFNDNAMIGVMKLLRDIADGDPDFAFVSNELKTKCQQAVQKGISCLLRCQIVINGKPTVWCAQHDQVDFQARPARSYELASFSASESVGIVQFLMQIEEPDKETINAIEGAIAWFEDAKLLGIKLVRTEDKALPEGFDTIVVNDPKAPPLWARFYDITTNQPFFCSRDGIPRKTLAEISHERRNGYSWMGTYAKQLLERDYPAWKKRLPEKIGN